VASKAPAKSSLFDETDEEEDDDGEDLFEDKKTEGVYSCSQLVFSGAAK